MATELGRVVRSEFRKASHELAKRDGGEDGIHEARKSVKKIRAILRIGEVGVRSRNQQTALRGVDHRLSYLRDLEVADATLARLRGRYPRVATQSVVRVIARGLRSRKRAGKSRAGSFVLGAERGLRRLCKSTVALVRDVGGFREVRAGFTRGYRRARKVMDSLSPESEATLFHEWRRRIKDHWYQVRLLEGLHPAPRGRARSLRKLERWLGDDHDCAVLSATIVATRSRFGNARAATIVLGCITEDQARLRHQALTLGHRLFSAKARQFRRNVTEWYRARHGLQK
jgi:CHAD domain